MNKTNTCDKCSKIFSTKSEYTRHQNRKTPCNKEIKKNNLETNNNLLNNTIETNNNLLNNTIETNNNLLNNTIETNNNQKLKMIDLFAGTGAFTLAFEDTEKVQCVFANDMDECSKKIYDENFNHKLTLKDLNDIKVEDIPCHDILTGGFPCFVAGTKILTSNCYKNIEDVNLTDKLITHSGKSQNILNLQQKDFSGILYNIKIKYHGEIITCTPEHPFYIREKNKKWNNELRKYDYFYSDPQWITAEKLDKKSYFGMVINTKSEIPEFTFTQKINQYNTKEVTIKLDKPEYWYLMGYFIGDGWIEESKKNIIRFSINNKDEQEVFEIINKVLPITDKKCDSGKCKKFGCINFVWFNIFKKFGKYAHGKKIPEWVHNAPKCFIEEFIKGYNKSDGYICNDIIQITTVSHDLAYSLQRLYFKLGHIFSINKCSRPNTAIIEGRTVNQKDTYCIRGKLDKTNESGFIENGYAWVPLSNIDIKNVQNIKVYNFEVDIDNSYIVDNTIVHNCQPFSIAGKQEGFEDERSNVFWKILEIIDYHTPSYVILENVKNLLSHDDNKTFEIISNELKKRGYNIKYKVLNTAEITGIPQHRERIYIVCIKSKEIYDKFSLDFTIIEKKQITDILENNIDNKYYYTDKSSTWDLVSKDVVKKNTVYQYRRVYVRENKSGECPTLTANMGTGGHNVPLILDDHGIRKLTPRECFNFQGFPEKYKLSNISDSRLYKLSGNAVSLPVVKLIANRLINLIYHK